MKKNYFLLLVAFFMTAMSYGQVNGGFESWTAGVPDGWTTVDFNTTDLTEDTSTFAEGAKSAKITLMTQTQGNTDIKQSVDLVSGVTYDVSLQVYATDNQARARIFGPSYTPNVYSDDALLNQWQTITFEYTSTTTGPIEFGIRFYDTAANWTGGNSIFYIDDFKVVAQTSPSVAITDPADGSVHTQGDDVTVTFAASNFDLGVADGTHDGHVAYKLDAGTAVQQYTTDAIVFSGLADGAHTVEIELVDDGNNPLASPAVATVSFTVQSYTAVADIATLRAGTINNHYELTGEALINYSQSFRSQKWIQDTTGGILIDDQPGNITAGVRGEGIKNIKGRLGEYQGMMQFIPLTDAIIVATPTVSVTLQVVTLADLTTSPEDYEAELVKVEGVTLTGTGDFANGTVYPMAQGTDAFDFRTNFYFVDYIATPIPTAAQDIVGLIAQNAGGYTFAARDLADFTAVAYVGDNVIEGLKVYPNPANGNVLNVRTTNNDTKIITIYNVLGNKVFTTVTSDTQINLPTIKAGIYLLNVEENGQSSTMKLMIK